ncbi:DUF551 domain-containing protein [Klebsiella oxytoca]|uniref:DUF551 domain-containing protein n=1 Tax=Klebsiella oxytoca TaxID=571 RepID=UPI00192DA3BE|nr:DUF551 domain-containing protein [Klebsiella oxytoca]DAU92301.1 MAG TPA: Protein of unknown function (DUF551) [Bacteriophage sp.]MBL5997467.1 DUF551 domain-containing protein [Klebsiella oxytoca]MBL6213328.1 DUF551 domain-containing protein [Klebsiella oxytoca]UHC78636.1 DUF551 domain-containing protein [Klebsiella oxytoca]UHC95714.1 DUF551 domain-containing protein [Klebsiella oxytoca]
MTLSKERLTSIAVAPGLEPCDYEETYSSITTGEIQAMARELLERRERDKQEPVAYTSSDALADVYCGETAMMGPVDTIGDVALYSAPPAPDIGDVRVGRLPTMNQDEYPGLGDWWVQLRIGEDSGEVLARVYGATPQEAKNRAEALACRAAMLQSFGNPEQLNSPVVPDGWIKCSERVPEMEGDCLVWVDASSLDGYCDHQAIAAYQGGEWSNAFNWLVTHWMPLPDAPQESTK